MISLFIFFSLLLTACGKMSNLPQGEFVNSYESPDSNFTINIYLCNGGATTDFAIRGELVDNHNTTKKNIYWGYHEEEADVNWIDENTVIINGRTLNVLKDVYDFRKEQGTIIQKALQKENVV